MNEWAAYINCPPKHQEMSQYKLAARDQPPNDRKAAGSPAFVLCV